MIDEWRNTMTAIKINWCELIETLSEISYLLISATASQPQRRLAVAVDLVKK